MTTILIKGHDGSISIEVVGYENPNATNPSDANWLTASIEVSVGAFTGKYRATLTTHDCHHFGAELDKVLETLSGKATFLTDEGWLRLEIDIASRGNASVTGEATVHGVPKSALSFAFETDQSYLRETQNTVNAVVRSFPVKS